MVETHLSQNVSSENSIEITWRGLGAAPVPVVTELAGNAQIAAS